LGLLPGFVPTIFCDMTWRQRLLILTVMEKQQKKNSEYT